MVTSLHRTKTVPFDEEPCEVAMGMFIVWINARVTSIFFKTTQHSPLSHSPGLLANLSLFFKPRATYSFSLKIDTVNYNRTFAIKSNVV